MSRAFSAILTMAALAGPVVGDDRPALKDALALQEVFQEAIKLAEPSVVCILVSRDERNQVHLEDTKTVPEAYGSGVVIGVREGRGLILTNAHVVRESSRLYVRLPGGKGSYATKFAEDPRSDLAVLALNDRLPVQPIKLGDGDTIRKGQMVLSIANPFAAGFHDGSPSASWGIISNIRRRAPGKPAVQEQDRARAPFHHFGTLLQLDARLNLGCSGGAVIDLKGELIGLTTALAALSGSETAGGFAVPMNARMRAIVKKLQNGEEVEYGFLGVRFLPDDGRGGFPNRRQTAGVLVNVVRGSPAYKAGLQGEVIIQAVDGMPVRESNDLMLAVGTLLTGTKTTLQVQGSGLKTVTLAKLYVPGPVVAANRPPWVHGLRVDYASILSQRGFPREEIPVGVFVSEVQPGTAAEKARLKDAIVTHVNGQLVTTPTEFYRAAARKPGPIELTLANQLEKVTLD